MSKLYWTTDSQDGCQYAVWNDGSENFTIRRSLPTVGARQYRLYRNQEYIKSYFTITGAKGKAQRLYDRWLLTHAGKAKEEGLREAVEHALRVEEATLEDIKQEAEYYAGNRALMTTTKKHDARVARFLAESAEHAACLINIGIYKKALGL